MTTPSHVHAKKVLDATLPQHESLVHMLLAAVDAKPNVTAIVYEQQRITYAELGRAVAGLATRLEAAGAKRGERVILLMANSIEMTVALNAVMATGAQFAPINPFLTLPELKKQLGDVQACVIVSDKLSEEKAAQVATQFNIPTKLTLGVGGVTLDAWKADKTLALDRSRLPKPDDLAFLIFTGGSTGVPKGVNHTHRALLYSVLQHVTVWPCEFGRERFLNVAPMFHIWGLGYSTFVPIYTQGTLVMVPRYDADKVVQGLSDHKITVFAGGPAPIYMGLLASPMFAKADLSQLRYCPSGGAPCPAELHREWLEKTGQPILEGWGMTEGAPFCLNPYDGKRKLLSVGNPGPGW
jgi:long-chain acyl-CoA synthetase